MIAFFLIAIHRCCLHNPGESYTAASGAMLPRILTVVSVMSTRRPAVGSIATSIADR